MDKDYAPIMCDIGHMTSKAVHVTTEDGVVAWVPFSQIFEDDLAGLSQGDHVELNIKQWFIDKEL